MGVCGRGWRPGGRGAGVIVEKEKPTHAKGAVIVSAIVLVTFGTVVTVALIQAVPESSKDTLNLLLGALTTMATSVVSYWVGSSAGSASKSETIDRLTGATPPPVDSSKPPTG
jgi:hypothetical protein